MQHHIHNKRKCYYWRRLKVNYKGFPFFHVFFVIVHCTVEHNITQSQPNLNHQKSKRTRKILRKVVTCWEYVPNILTQLYILWPLEALRYDVIYTNFKRSSGLPWSTSHAILLSLSSLPDFSYHFFRKFFKFLSPLLFFNPSTFLKISKMQNSFLNMPNNISIDQIYIFIVVFSLWI
jgi:hypothetical protein